MKYIVLLLSVTSFASEFDAYVQRFVAASEKYSLIGMPPIQLQNIQVEFVETPRGLAGYYDRDRIYAYCEKGFPGDTPTVKVVRKSWEKADDAMREMILFHEFGHCLLNRPHRDDSIALNHKRAPASLMTPNAFDPKAYELNRDYYLEELFLGILTR